MFAERHGKRKPRARRGEISPEGLRNPCLSDSHCSVSPKFTAPLPTPPTPCMPTLLETAPWLPLASARTRRCGCWAVESAQRRATSRRTEPHPGSRCAHKCGRSTTAEHVVIDTVFVGAGAETGGAELEGHHSQLLDGVNRVLTIA